MSRLIPGRDPVLDESAQVEQLASNAVSTLARPGVAPVAVRLPEAALLAPADAEPVLPHPVDPAEERATPERDTDLGPIDAAEGPVAALWREHLAAPSRATRDNLVLHYVSLVRAVAHRMAGGLPAHVDLADLVQSGVFGLLDAIERFDPVQCARFETYAAQRIRGAMLDELRAQDWVPRTVRGRVRELERAQERLQARLRRAVTDRELADEMGIPVADLRAMVRRVQLLSVEALDEGSGGRGGVSETLIDDALPDPMAVVQHQETTRQLTDAVGQLGERDRAVIRMYYLENRTLAEIGRCLGVTESRVCQLHSRLVVQLRGRLEELAAG
jgi:RNA polymerase sigma factor for flagellar operon FliA